MPALWFGLWHYAPGSVSDTHPWLLVRGALILGLVYGYLAQQTKTIRWAAVSHVLPGLAPVIALYPIGG